MYFPIVLKAVSFASRRRSVTISVSKFLRSGYCRQRASKRVLLQFPQFDISFRIHMRASAFPCQNSHLSDNVTLTETGNGCSVPSFSIRTTHVPRRIIKRLFPSSPCSDEPFPGLESLNVRLFSSGDTRILLDRLEQSCIEKELKIRQADICPLIMFQSGQLSVLSNVLSSCRFRDPISCPVFSASLG